MSEQTGHIDFTTYDETHKTQWVKVVGDLDFSVRPFVVLHGGPEIAAPYLGPHLELYTKLSIPLSSMKSDADTLSTPSQNQGISVRRAFHGRVRQRAFSRSQTTLIYTSIRGEAQLSLPTTSLLAIRGDSTT